MMPHPDELEIVFVTNDLSELMMVKSLLESYEIHCYTKDELTVQTYHFIANAVGGIKLMVNKSDAEDAKSILTDGGYPLPEQNDYDESEVKAAHKLQYLDKATSGIPVLNKLNFLPRIFILFALIIIIAAIALYYIMKPSTAEYLVLHEWCMDTYSYNGQQYDLDEGIIHYKPGWHSCYHQLQFLESQTINFFLVKNNTITGKWHIEGGDLIISNCTQDGDVFNGRYSIHIADRQLVLSSTQTQIILWYSDNKGFYD